MRTTTARTTLAVSALALAVGLSGCGGDSEDSASTAETSETTEAPEPDESEPEETEPDETEPDETGSGGGTGPLTADDFAQRVAAAQLGAGSAHLEGVFGSGAREVRLEGDVVVDEDPDDLALRMSVSVPGGDQSFEMIVVDETLYLDQGPGGKYLEVDLDDESNPLAQQFSAAIEGADPSAQVEALDEALLDLEEVGTESIDGVETTQYRATLDGKELLGESGLAGSAPPAAQLPKRLTYDVFVGTDDDLLRRFDFEISGISSSFTFTDWGEPVEVQAPPESQIAPSPQA